jgi:hypothetical protein
MLHINREKYDILHSHQIPSHLTFACPWGKLKFTFHEKQNKGCNAINKEQLSSSKIITYHK